MKALQPQGFQPSFHRFPSYSKQRLYKHPSTPPCSSCTCQERWSSGLWHPIRNRTWGNTHRGFKSHPLRLFSRVYDFGLTEDLTWHCHLTAIIHKSPILPSGFSAARFLPFLVPTPPPVTMRDESRHGGLSGQA